VEGEKRQSFAARAGYLPECARISIIELNPDTADWVRSQDNRFHNRCMLALLQPGSQLQCISKVSLGSKSEIQSGQSHVRSSPGSRHAGGNRVVRLRASFGLMRCSNCKGTLQVLGTSPRTHQALAFSVNGPSWRSPSKRLRMRASSCCRRSSESDTT
jgi:hypothetical protein